MNYFYPPYIPRPFHSNYNDYKEKEFHHEEDTVLNKQKSSSYSSFGPISFKNPIFTNNIDEPIFEIFGIELYLDDIIIIGLLFLLYKEGVQDELLYIALILLLVG